MSEEIKQPEFVTINDTNHFASLLRNWHSGKVAVLQHMLTIPEGTEMVIDGDTSAAAILQGDMLAGFKAGLELALIELGTLPFVFEMEADAATPN